MEMLIKFFWTNWKWQFNVLNKNSQMVHKLWSLNWKQKHIKSFYLLCKHERVSTIRAVSRPSEVR